LRPAFDEGLGLMVADPVALTPVPRDGVTIGEVMLGRNAVMKRYLRNLTATEEVFRGGWFHSGDLDLLPGRLHRDQGPEEDHHLGRREHLLARGGALPAPDDHRGGHGRKDGPDVGRDSLHVRNFETGRRGDTHLARFKAPRAVVFRTAAEDLHRKTRNASCASR
jgi:hypothetical protein